MVFSGHKKDAPVTLINIPMTKSHNVRGIAKDLKEAVKSKAFEETIDREFAGFGKPKWMTQS